LSLLNVQQRFLAQKALRQDRAAEQPVPALHHLLRRPRLGQRLIHVQNQVVVRGHNRIATHLDGEDLRQLQQPLLDPVSAMLEGAPGEGILATKEGAAHAARDAVVVGGRFQTDQ
jgi:hypothetical protein